MITVGKADYTFERCEACHLSREDGADEVRVIKLGSPSNPSVVRLCGECCSVLSKVLSEK